MRSRFDGHMTYNSNSDSQKSEFTLHPAIGKHEALAVFHLPEQTLVTQMTSCLGAAKSQDAQKPVENQTHDDL